MLSLVTALGAYGFLKNAEPRAWPTDTFAPHKGSIDVGLSKMHKGASKPGKLSEGWQQVSNAKGSKASQYATVHLESGASALLYRQGQGKIDEHTMVAAFVPGKAGEDGNVQFHALIPNEANDDGSFLEMEKEFYNPYAVAATAFAFTWFPYGMLGGVNPLLAPYYGHQEGSMERGDKAFPFHVRMSPHKKFHFDTVADFEAFSPLMAPFFFHPLGLFWAGSFYGAFAAAATAGAAAVAATPFAFPMTPFNPFAAHMPTADGQAAAQPDQAETMAKMKTWYWSTLWFFHSISYFSLFWQMSGLMWYWWGQTVWPTYSAYLQKVAAYWTGLYTQGADAYKKWLASLPKYDPTKFFPFYHPFIAPAAAAPAAAAPAVAAPVSTNTTKVETSGAK